jgi:secernin
MCDTVVIGNEAVFTRQPCEKVGLTGMDLLRLSLERADTAERACDVITDLLAEYGQGGGCGHEHRTFTYHNSFIIADPTGAFVLETAGREWARERVQGARTISNELTIRSFADKHSDWLKTRVSGCRLRQPRTQDLAGRCTDVADLFALLRDHGQGRGEPAYSWLNGGLGAPCVHAGGLVAASQTTGSWVSELSGGTARHWVTGTSAPCISLFKPVLVKDPVAMEGQPAEIADDRSLWWRHERFQRAVMRNPAELRPYFTPQRDEVEAEWLRSPPDGRAAFARGDDLLRQWSEAVLARPARDIRPFRVRRYWERRSRWAGI